jgi:hypothetical protein
LLAPPLTGPALQAAQALAQLRPGPLPQRLTLELHPADLGTLRISLAPDARGDAASLRPGPVISIAADHPATLALVQADTHALNQALDRAGIATDGRVLHFHLAEPSAPDPSGLAAQGHLSAPAWPDGSAPDGSANANAGGPGQHGHSPRGHAPPGQSTRRAISVAATAADPDAAPLPAPSGAIDLTA